MTERLTKHTLYPEQVALLFQHAPLACLVTLGNSVLLVAVHWHTVAQNRLLGWLAAMWLVAGLRWWIAQRCAEFNQTKLATAHYWGRWYVTLTLLAGLGWGVVAMMLFTTQTLEQRVFTMFVLAGMGAGSLPLLAAVKTAAIGFITLLTLPVAVVFALQGTQLALVFALMLLIFLLAMIKTTSITHRSILQTLQLRQTNQILLAEAVAQKQALHETNRLLEARVEARTADLHRLANYDSLTGLANRQRLQDCLEYALAHAQRSGGEVAVLFLDLDRFKSINDSLGHDTGDAVLKAVAERLKACVRRTDTVARLGGDEFILILERLKRAEEVADIARKILSTLAEPIALEQQPLHIGASIGISRYPEDGDAMKLLLKHADLALQRAKQQGRRQFCFYTPTLNATLGERLKLETELSCSLAERTLELYYQPIVNLRSGAVTGVEALLRWQHPARGLLGADEFIPLAEESGLIVPIGIWALQTACAQLQTWRSQMPYPLTVSVNLSARQFLQANLVEQIIQCLSATGLPANALKLEITETMIMQDLQRTHEILQTLKELGARIAIDDFGTGYSSLSYLKRLPLDELKVDRSFLPDIIGNPNDAMIVTAIIRLAHSLGLIVTVEGVETEAVCAFVRAREADQAQGFYLGRPMPATSMATWMQAPLHLPITYNSAQTILVLDDDLAITELLEIWLTAEGYQVYTAERSEQALEMLAHYSVDVLIADYVLPGIDGIEFLRRVRIMYPQIVRLLLSNKTNLEALGKAVNEAGIAGFLTKPVSEAQLCAAVRTAFAQRTAGMQFMSHELAKPDGLSSTIGLN